MSRVTIQLGPVTVIDDGDGVIRRNDRFLGPFVPGPYGGRGISMEDAEGRLEGLGVDRLEGARVTELLRIQPRVNRLWREAQAFRDEGGVWDDLQSGIGDVFETIGEPIEALIVGAARLFH